MSQNINLFAATFRKERQILTLKELAVGLALLLLVLAGVLFYQERESAGIADEMRSAEAVLKAQGNYADKLKAEVAARKSSASLEAETLALESELKQAREAMDALNGGAIGSQQGFSEYLRAFSRQSVSGLWLTGLTITGNGDLEIRGRAVSAELVPGYIQGLKNEKVLAGRSFARLEMGQPRTEPDRGKDKDGKGASLPPRYLEFSLATAEPAAAGKTP